MWGRGAVHTGLPEGNTLLGRPRRRREYNTKMDLREAEWGHGLAQNSGRRLAIVNVVTKLLVP